MLIAADGCAPAGAWPGASTHSPCGAQRTAASESAVAAAASGALSSGSTSCGGSAHVLKRTTERRYSPLASSGSSSYACPPESQTSEGRGTACCSVPSNRRTRPATAGTVVSAPKPPPPALASQTQVGPRTFGPTER